MRSTRRARQDLGISLQRKVAQFRKTSTPAAPLALARTSTASVNPSGCREEDSRCWMNWVANLSFKYVQPRAEFAAAG